MTRKMHQKKYSRFFPRDILAQKLSISFHPEDNDKLTYAEAYKMAEDLARVMVVTGKNAENHILSENVEKSGRQIFAWNVI